MSSLAFGVSPVLIEAPDIAVNTSVTKTLSIVRSRPETDEQLQITATGAAAPYIKLPQQGTIFLPKGVQIVTYEFYIQTQNKTSGIYEGDIKIFSPKPLSSSAQHSGSSVVTASTVHVRFNVAQQPIYKQPSSLAPFLAIAFFGCVVILMLVRRNRKT